MNTPVYSTNFDENKYRGGSTSMSGLGAKNLDTSTSKSPLRGFRNLSHQN